MHKHFAFRAANEVLRRFPRETKYTVEAGVTPSGKIHLGNFNDVVIADAVLRALRNMGYEARGFLIVDSRDPFRKPPIFAPEDFKREARKYVGKPFVNIPDPWGCHENYALHFVEPVENKLSDYGVDIEVKWAKEIHSDPSFIKALLSIIERREKVRELLNEIRRKAGHKSLYDEKWIPYRPLCEKCGRIDEKVVPIKVEGSKIYYRCEWCGHTGIAEVHKAEGKPPWRIDWPLRWYVLKVNFEPLGKDHMASGSGYDTGAALIEKFFLRKPPVPVFYDFVYWVEWRGNAKEYRKFSKREGIGLGVDEWIEIAPPEVLRFLILKRDISDIYSEALSHWEFDIRMIPQYVQEFDRFEEQYFSIAKNDEEEGRLLIKDMYMLSVIDKPPKRKPKRLNYWQAVRVAAWMINLKDGMEMLRRQGKLTGLSEDEIRDAEKRLRMAYNWLLRVGYSVVFPSINEFKLRLKSLNSIEKKAVMEILKGIKEGNINETNVGEEVKRVAKELGLSDRKGRLRIYRALYRLLFNEESGPPLKRLIVRKEFKEYLAKVT